MTNLIKMKIEVIFLVFALIFGSMFAVINPPFISLDEGAHFVKAFDVSQGHIIPSNGPTIDIPKSIFSIPGIRGLNNNLVYSISDSKKFDYIPYLKIPFNIKDTIEIGQRNTNVYMPLPYLATALVIKIGEFFNISPLVLLYFGRLINLLFYIVVVYFAIKIVPIGKYIFLLLALMPMSLYSASSVSADSLNLALSFFTIAIFLNLAFKDNKINKKDIALLAICVLALSLSKQLYALLGLLFFIIPMNKFKNIKNRVIYFIYAILPSGILFLIWNHLVKTYSNLGGSVITNKSSFINYPLHFIPVLMNTIYIWFNHYLTLFVGSFGWDAESLPSSFIYIYLLMLLTVSVLDLGKFRLSLKQKLFSFVLFLMGSLTLFIMAYGWTINREASSAFETIWGIHGRYFIPLAPLLFLTLSNKNIHNYLIKKRLLNHIKSFIIVFVTVILSSSSYILYYGHLF